MRRFIVMAALLPVGLAMLLLPSANFIDASSHREAPLIANDPVADNADLWVFRSPDSPNSVTIVASFIGLELPEGGPNWTTFAEGVRYEIHIKNKPSQAELGAAKDDITYRFTFSQTNEDPTTFFNIRLGKQNLKTTYKCEKSTDGGTTFTAIVNNGIVPPNFIGPRSIASSAGLNKSYTQIVQEAINTSSPDGERMLVGPFDDPFFVDLGGVFDLGQTRQGFGNDPNNPNFARDAVAGFNVHAIVMNIPIAKLQKDSKTVAQAENILDQNYVIGVWAASYRPRVTTLSPLGAKPTYSGDYVQVSRLGMPLVNEAIIPIGLKDKWNAVSPYSKEEQDFIVPYFVNPELALYMDDSQFGGAIPALSALRIQSRAYPAIGVIPTYTTPGFDFRNGKDGAFAVTKLNPVPNLAGTAFAVNLNNGLVGAGQPRAVDFYPIFYFGVPNLIPYQLATGKTGGPLSAGKPFIHNFLPLTVDSKGKIFGGDVLRLNMATPVTPRNTAEYRVNARMGLIRAAAIGLTAPPFNTNRNLEPIPHMDGFPNGRRLEDDVTTIELQATGGLVLAAVGLGFDDAVQANYSDLASTRLVAELTYDAGPTANDVPLSFTFPYLALPHRGYDYVKQLTAKAPGTTAVSNGHINIGVPRAFIIEQNYPNPFNPSTEIKYHVSANDVVKLRVFNQLGQVMTTLVDKPHTPGAYSVVWDAKDVPSGTYYYRLEVGNDVMPAKKAVLVK